MDEKLFDKLKFLSENVIGSAHLIHNSINELHRASNAAHTTLNNSINAFNAINFNKFIENVSPMHKLTIYNSKAFILFLNFCRWSRIFQKDLSSPKKRISPQTTCLAI